MRQLWIIAGPNGSGKTSLVQKYLRRFTENIPVVNPDNIAFKINPDNPGLVAMQAGREALKQQNHFLKNGGSFVLETTFSGKRELKILQQANGQGFKTNLVFVGLASPIDNIQRVSRRVLDGGHDVPVVDIERRYHRSMENLLPGLGLVDRAFVFDNADKKHRLVAVFEHGQIVRQSDNQPEWFKNFVPLEIGQKKGAEWQVEFVKNGSTVKSEKMVVPAELAKKDQLKRVGELARKIASKNNLGVVQTKFTQTEEKVSLQKNIEQKKDRGR